MDRIRSIVVERQVLLAFLGVVLAMIVTACNNGGSGGGGPAY